MGEGVVSIARIVSGCVGFVLLLLRFGSYELAISSANRNNGAVKQYWHRIVASVSCAVVFALARCKNLVI